MRHTIGVIVLGLCVGCASMSVPCAVQGEQFEVIVERVEAQVRARPPATPVEAERLSEVITIANQGAELARVNLKRVGAPKGPIPPPTDFRAVRRMTEVYEEEVDLFNTAKAGIRNLIPSRWNLQDAATGGGALGLVTMLVRMWRKKRKADLVNKQYDDGIQAQDPKERRKIKLGPEAQAAHERIDAERKARAAA